MEDSHSRLIPIAAIAPNFISFISITAFIFSHWFKSKKSFFIKILVLIYTIFILFNSFLIYLQILINLFFSFKNIGYKSIMEHVGLSKHIIIKRNIFFFKYLFFLNEKVKFFLWQKNQLFSVIFFDLVESIYLIRFK